MMMIKKERREKRKERECDVRENKVTIGNYKKTDSYMLSSEVMVIMKTKCNIFFIHKKMYKRAIRGCANDIVFNLYFEKE